MDFRRLIYTNLTSLASIISVNSASVQTIPEQILQVTELSRYIKNSECAASQLKSTFNLMVISPCRVK